MFAAPTVRIARTTKQSVPVMRWIGEHIKQVNQIKE